MAVSKADAEVVIKVNVRDTEARAKLLGIAAQLRALDGLDPQGSPQPGTRRQTRVQKFGKDIANAGTKLDSLMLKVDSAKQLFTDFNTSVDKNSEAIERNQQAWASWRLNIVGLSQHVKEITTQFQSLDRETKKVYDSMKKLDVELRQKSRDVSRLKSDFDKLDKGIAKARKSTDGMRNGVSKLGKWFQQVLKLTKFVIIEFGIMALAVGALKLALVSGELTVKAFNATMRGLGVAVGWTAGTVVAGVGTILAAIRQLQMAKLAPLIDPQVRETGLGAAAQSSLLESSRSLAMFQTQTLTSITSEAARAGKTINGQFLSTIQTLGNFAIVAGDPNTALSELTVAFLRAGKEGKVTEEIFESIAQASPDLKKGFEEVYGSGKKLDEALKAGKVSFTEILQMFQEGKIKSLEPFKDALDDVNNTLVGRLRQSIKGVKEQLIELGAPLLETIIGPLNALEQNVRIFLFRVGPTIQKVFKQIIPEDGGDAMPRFFDSLAKAVNEHLPKMVGFLDRMQKGWKAFSQGWNDFFGKIGAYLREVTNSWNTLWNKILKPIGEEFFDIIDHAIREFSGFIEEGNFDNFASKIGEISEGIKELISGFNELRKILAPIVDSILTLLGALSQILKLPGIGTAAAVAGLGLYMGGGGGPVARARARGQQPGLLARSASLLTLPFMGMSALQRGPLPDATRGTLRGEYQWARNMRRIDTGQVQTPVAPPMGGMVPAIFPAKPVPVTRPSTRLEAAAYAAGQKWSQVTRRQKMTGLAGALALGGMFAGDLVAGNDAANTGRSVVGGALSGAASGAAAGAMIGSVIPVKGTAIGAAVGAIVGGIAGGVTGLFSARSAQAENKEAARELAKNRIQQGLLTNDLSIYREKITEVGSEIENLTLLAQYEDGELKNLSPQKIAYIEGLKKEYSGIKELDAYRGELAKGYNRLNDQQRVMNGNINTLADGLGMTSFEAAQLALTLDQDLSLSLISFTDFISILGYEFDEAGKIIDSTISRAQGAGRFLSYILEPIAEASKIADLANRRQQAVTEFSAAIESGDREDMTISAGNMIGLLAEEEMGRFQRGEISYDEALQNIRSQIGTQRRSIGQYYASERYGEAPIGASVYSNLASATLSRLDSAQNEFQQRMQFDPAYALQFQTILRGVAGVTGAGIGAGSSSAEVEQALAAGTSELIQKLSDAGFNFTEDDKAFLQKMLGGELIAAGEGVATEIKNAIEQSSIKIDWETGKPWWVPDQPGQYHQTTPADRLEQKVNPVLGPPAPAAAAGAPRDTITPSDKIKATASPQGQGPTTTSELDKDKPPVATTSTTIPPPPNPGTTTPVNPPIATPAATMTTVPWQPPVMLGPGAVRIEVNGTIDPFLLGQNVAPIVEEQLRRRVERGYRP